jgi:hypothetical protein
VLPVKADVSTPATYLQRLGILAILGSTSPVASTIRLSVHVCSLFRKSLPLVLLHAASAKRLYVCWISQEAAPRPTRCLNLLLTFSSIINDACGEQNSFEIIGPCLEERRICVS